MRKWQKKHTQWNTIVLSIIFFFPSSKVHTYKLIDRALKAIINSRNKVQGSHAHKKEKKSFWNSAEHHLHYIFIDIFFFFYNLILFHTAVAFYFQDWIIKKKSEYIAKKKRRGMAISPCCQTIKHFKKLRVCPNCWFFFLHWAHLVIEAEMYVKKIQI